MQNRLVRQDLARLKKKQAKRKAENGLTHRKLDEVLQLLKVRKPWLNCVKTVKADEFALASDLMILEFY